MRKKLVALSMAVLMLAVCVIGGTLAYFTDDDHVENTFTVGNVKIDLYETENGKKTDTGITFTDAIVPGHEFAKDPTIEVMDGSQNSYIFLDMTINKYKSLCPVMAKDAAEQGIGGYTNDMFKQCLDPNNDNKFSTLAFLGQMQQNPGMFRAIVDRWFVGIDHSKWDVCGFFYNVDDQNTTVKGNFMTIRFAYIGGDAGKVSASADPICFMTGFQMPSTVTQDMVENKEANVTPFNDAKIGFKMNFTAYAIQAAEIADVDAAFIALFGNELGDYWTSIA